MIKLAVELSEFRMKFARTSIKGHALANFIVESIRPPPLEVRPLKNKREEKNYPR